MIEHRDADLTGSRFRNVDLSGTQIRSAFLRDVVITDSWLENARIEGEIRSLTVNGVDVTAYVEAELDRRHPERRALKPNDVAGLRRAWSEAIERAGATSNGPAGCPPISSTSAWTTSSRSSRRCATSSSHPIAG